MGDNRQKLLKALIQNFSQIFRDIHKEQKFSFGNLVLTRQQMMIMFFINEKGRAVSAKEVAEFLHVTAGAITQFVDGLVKNKLVERKENSADRRSLDIDLTKKTKREFDYLKNDSIKKITMAFSKLSNSELKQFVYLTGKVKASRGEINKK